MFVDLPQSIQQQVLYYLGVDNFRAAKELYDQHLKGQRHSEEGIGSEEDL